MVKIKTLKNWNEDHTKRVPIAPRTHVKAVFDDNGNTLDSLMAVQDEKLSELGSKTSFVSFNNAKFEGNTATIEGRVSRNGVLSTIVGAFTFDNSSYLVLHKDNTTEIVEGSPNIKPDDIVLLYYSSTEGFIGGEFYAAYSKSKVDVILPNTKKYVSTRGAVYEKFVTLTNITLNTLFVYDSDGTSVTKVEDSTKWVLNELNRYLVLNKNNVLVTRSQSTHLLPTDYVLLYADLVDGKINIKGGALYADYLAFMQDELESKTDFVAYNSAKFDGNTATIEGRIVRDGTINTIVGTFSFDKSGYLILHKDNTIEIVEGSSNIKSDDIVLLYYTLAEGFIGGEFYAAYVKSKADAILSNVKKYVSTRGTVYEKFVTLTNVTLNTLFVYDADGTSITKVEDSTKWVLNKSNRYLVLNKNNVLTTRSGSADLLSTDLVLLYFDYIDEAHTGIKGGVLYADYLAYVQESNKKLQNIYSRTVNFTQSSIEITSVFLMENGGPVQTIYATDDMTPKTIVFGYDCRYLVLNKDRKLATRAASADVKEADIILLVYDYNLGKFVSGPLFLQYLASQSEIRDRPENLGVFNVIRKAHQMTDVQWVAAAPIEYNVGTYAEGSVNKGVIYSSVKEMNQFVNEDISMHTLMTALHNPRTIIYKERADVSPLHGKNCRAWYGTVCSGLVGYAMGIKTNFRTYDFIVADFMEKVKGQDIYNLKLGDFLWRPGHTGIVTDIYRDKYGVPTKIEICEALMTGCTRYYIKGHALQELINSTDDATRWEFYRNKNLADNVEYTPYTDFVAVEGEQLTPFNYNDDIITYKGDKALYINGEDVKLLIREDFALLGYTSIQLFRNDSLVNTLNITSSEMSLSNLEYGAYKSRLVKADGTYSDFTYWKVIDVNVSIDKTENKVFFSSANSTPLYFEFCSIDGFRSEEYKKDTIHILNDEEINRGYIMVEPPSTDRDSAGRTYTYVKVHFQDEYGRVINAPLEWYS